MERVDEIESLSGDLGLLLSSGIFSDVTFLVEGEKLLAHRIIMASRSEYFRVLLFVVLAESEHIMIGLDVKLKPFKLILNYIYTGRVELDQLDDEDFMDLLGLVHKYKMKKLQSAVVNILQGKLSLETCYWLYNTAVKYDLKGLLETCNIFMDKNAETFVTHPSFGMLTKPAFALFTKNIIGAEEIDILIAAKAWCERFPIINRHSTHRVQSEVLLRTLKAKFGGFEEVTNSLEHPLCKTNAGFECKSLHYTMCNLPSELYVVFERKVAICCIRFYFRCSINTALDFSADQIKWTILSEDIAERTKKEIRFKKAIPVRFLRFHSYNGLIESITGMPFE